MRTYVAVDGGMSDNLRPMLYGARYEAVIADRAGAPATRTVTVAGMHCESSDMLVRDVALADPRAGDVLVTPATGAYGYAMANNYNARPAAAGDLLRRRRRRAGRPPRDLRRPDGARCLTPAPPRRGRVASCGATWRVSACWATGPSARRSPSSSPSAPSRSRRSRAGGRSSPGCCGAPRATSSEILADSDVVVELIGGTDPAREYVLRALEAGKHVITANKQLVAQHGDELFAAARAAGVQLRFEAAVAGVVPVIRVIQESLAATRIEKVFGIVNGTTNFILSRDGLDRGLVRRRARPRPGARLRRGRPDRGRRRRRRGGEDGDPRPARLRHRRSASTTSPTRGSPRSSPRTSPTRRSSACR